jgi:hypothetical protein
VTIEIPTAAMGVRCGAVVAPLRDSLYCAKGGSVVLAAQRVDGDRRDVLYGRPRTVAGPDALLLRVRGETDCV